MSLWAIVLFYRDFFFFFRQDMKRHGKRWHRRKGVEMHQDFKKREEILGQWKCAHCHHCDVILTLDYWHSLWQSKTQSIMHLWGGRVEDNQWKLYWNFDFSVHSTCFLIGVNRLLRNGISDDLLSLSTLQTINHLCVRDAVSCILRDGGVICILFHFLSSSPSAVHSDLRGKIISGGQLSPPSDCSLVQGNVSSHRMWHGSYHRFLLNWGKMEQQWWIGLRNADSQKVLQVITKANSVNCCAASFSHT